MKPQPGLCEEKGAERASWPPSASVGRFLPPGSGGWLPATEEGGAQRPPSNNLTTFSLLLGPPDLCLHRAFPSPASGCLTGSRWRGGVARPLPLPLEVSNGSLEGAWAGSFLLPGFLSALMLLSWVGRGGQGEGGVSLSLSLWWRVGGKSNEFTGMNGAWDFGKQPLLLEAG